jgi:hypothetical protein
MPLQKGFVRRLTQNELEQRVQNTPNNGQSAKYHQNRLKAFIVDQRFQEGPYIFFDHVRACSFLFPGV